MLYDLKLLFSQPKYTKITVVFLIFFFFFLYRIINEDNITLNADFQSKYFYCFYDKVLLEYTNNLTIFLSQNLIFRDIILILGSGCLDILTISFLLYFTQYGNSCKPVINLLMFYSFRALLQSWFLFDFYGTYLFDDTGFISIVVTYKPKAADFFYSGHSGCALILSLAFMDFGEPVYFYFGLVTTLLQCVTMMITRAHYSIDIIFGLLFAHLFYIWSGKIYRIIDDKFPIFKNSINEIGNNTNKKRGIQMYELKDLYIDY